MTVPASQNGYSSSLGALKNPVMGDMIAAQGQDVRNPWVNQP
jgi:hypothetical protein